MSVTTLIVPGYHGSGPDHWQTWLEGELPGSQRLADVDWEKPVLHDWSAAIVDAIDAATSPLWIVAHSFGCLATAAAVAQRRQKIQGAIFVAPAEPNRFTALGARGRSPAFAPGIGEQLPEDSLGIFGLLIASRNDPWMRFQSARLWAERWQLSFYDAGHVGHINAESGHGRWPLVLELLQAMRRAAAPLIAPQLLQPRADRYALPTPMVQRLRYA